MMILRRGVLILAFLVLAVPWIAPWCAAGTIAGAVMWLVTGEGFSTMDHVVTVGMWPIDKLADWADV